ncbi:MAG: hypothetical protein LAN61_02405 [Acidobacteriia bacterium]|nr:hypothetical protein [Terriglobia bacterium]
MQPFSTQVAERSNQRRSQRVLLSLPVEVTAQQGVEKKPVSEKTRTMVVNAHGALVQLNLKVEIGQQLTVKNLKTSEEAHCRVVFVNHAQLSNVEVGLEFLKPAPLFWRIAFPPADWTPRSPDAKGSASKGGAAPAHQRPVAAPSAKPAPAAAPGAKPATTPAPASPAKPNPAPVPKPASPLISTPNPGLKK